MAPRGRDDRAMLKLAARFLLLRFLPRRIVPIVTVVEALLFIRSIRKRSRVKVNRPSASGTAPLAPTARDRPTATVVAGSTATELSGSTSTELRGPTATEPATRP
jgi:hypothetical protein